MEEENQSYPNFKISFTEWVRDNYFYEIWCQSKSIDFNNKKNYELFIREYKQPSSEQLCKLRNTSLLEEYLNDVGNPSYIDGP